MILSHKGEHSQSSTDLDWAIQHIGKGGAHLDIICLSEEGKPHGAGITSHQARQQDAGWWSTSRGLRQPPVRRPGTLRRGARPAGGESGGPNGDTPMAADSFLGQPQLVAGIPQEGFFSKLGPGDDTADSGDNLAILVDH